jgi:RNA polymerase sigma-70 factor, ECF subfamily
VSAALTPTIDGGLTAPLQGIAAEDFERIVRDHQKRVYRVLFLLLRSADAADTLTQECFLRAYEKKATFRGECRVDTWLLRIAANLAHDHVRNRRAGFWKRLVGMEDAGPAGHTIEFPAQQASPERELLARREVEAVWSAAGQLPDRQRTIFILRFAEEMSLQEISQVLRLKEGTVKTHLFRAVGAVRDKLKEQQWR